MPDDATDPADEPTDPYRSLLADLAAEHEALDRVVAPLAPEAWRTPTPAEGWDVADTISHLEHFDRAAVLAATDAEAFAAEVEEAIADPEFMERSVALARRSEPAELLAAWREGRSAMLATFAGLGGRDRLPWYGPPMSAMSFATARLMETWAHGQDVVDAVGADRPATDRLRHVAHLGVRTRGFSYAVRGEEAPTAEVRVELEAPSGAVWTWGDEAADQRVAGPALDFCLLVTQRRHLDDLALEVEGEAARDWMGRAQAFAGPPGPGRPPGGG